MLPPYPRQLWCWKPGLYSSDNNPVNWISVDGPQRQLGKKSTFVYSFESRSITVTLVPKPTQLTRSLPNGSELDCTDGLIYR